MYVFQWLEKNIKTVNNNFDLKLFAYALQAFFYYVGDRVGHNLVSNADL